MVRIRAEGGGDIEKLWRTNHAAERTSDDSRVL
jgi:hypothetical protein